MKTIADFIESQRKFDGQHHSTYDWSATVNESNVEILEHILLAVLGELGEAANVVKKVVRGDRSLEESKTELTEEITDVFIYMLKLIYQLDIDIEDEYRKKMEFNTVKFEKYRK